MPCGILPVMRIKLEENYRATFIQIHVIHEDSPTILAPLVLNIATSSYDVDYTKNPALITKASPTVNGSRRRRSEGR
jgi:hypothetical protein